MKIKNSTLANGQLIQLLGSYKEAVIFKNYHVSSFFYIGFRFPVF